MDRDVVWIFEIDGNRVEVYDDGGIAVFNKNGREVEISAAVRKIIECKVFEVEQDRESEEINRWGFA